MNAPARPVAVAGRSRFKWVFPGLLALFALALLTAALFANVNRQQGWSSYGQPSRNGSPSNSITVALPNLVRPLTPEEAVQQNLERPFDMVPDTPAQQFQLRADDNSRARAVECLTQAVYYEAASEGPDGQRAVAQVVLNRMHHPGFPSTVCGVVYQGSELPTGCQFTFTCDGSLSRTPVPALWTAARRIAVQALDGSVDAAVGHATHYHADYVLPYWADSLLKQVQVGHHIFYRLRGTLGSSGAFSQRYGGMEPSLPPPQSTIAVANEATDQAQELLNSNLTAPLPVAADAAGLAGGQQPKQVLLADSSKGELLIDQGATPVRTSSKSGADSDCPPSGGKQILPAAPTDMRARSDGSGC